MKEETDAKGSTLCRMNKKHRYCNVMIPIATLCNSDKKPDIQKNLYTTARMQLLQIKNQAIVASHFINVLGLPCNQLISRVEKFSNIILGLVSQTAQIQTPLDTENAKVIISSL